jgi:HK97 family phage portal protein
MHVEALEHRERELVTLHAEALQEHEKRAITFDQFSSLGLINPPVAAGVPVSQQTANTVSAYWNGVCVISGDLGALDRHLYRRGAEDDDRDRATSHPAYKVIHEQPNPETTAMKFWETLASHAVSWGNGYAEIEFDGAMRPIGLWNITPDTIEPKVETFVDRRGRITSKVYYLYRGTTRIEAEDILHVSGLGFDGVRGYSPVYLARQSLGLGIAAERFGAAFFGGGAWPGLAVQHPKTLSAPAIERLKETIQGTHGGVDRAHRLIVLEEGMTVSKPITIPPEDAQFLETRSFQIEEVARWLNINPHKLKHMMNERPGGNLESSELDYCVTTLLPWTTRIEQECDRKLITPALRSSYYTEHNFSKRLRVDTITRMNAYKSLFDMHVIDAEQIARKENLPKPKPRPALPAATPPAPADPAPPPVPAEASPRSTRVATAERALLAAIVLRYVRREAENAKRAAKKGMPAFGDWVETFYSEGEGAVLRESLEPAVALCMATAESAGDPGAVAQGFASRHLARSKTELLSVKTKDVEANVSALLKRWETSRTVEGVEELMAALGAAEEEEDVA